jgi:cobalt-zinc-cadmium efflux system membrane fusion protein
LFEIVNPSDIHLALTVFEKDINKMVIGQSVAVTRTLIQRKHYGKNHSYRKDFSENKSTEMHYILLNTIECGS